MDCDKVEILRTIALPSILSLILLINIVGAQSRGYPNGLSLSGNQSLTITQNQTITGDINLSGHAVLTIKNAVVLVQHAQNSPRENINMHDEAKLVLQNASLVPVLLDPANLYLTALDNSQVIVNDSSMYNVVNLVGNSRITGNRAEIYSSTYPFYIPETGGAFGIIQLAQNAQANFSNSTIGSFALFFGPQDSAQISNLKPQRYANFNLKRDFQRFSPSYNIILKNTTILPVVLHGPFERSWSVFVDPSTNITIRNSSLNKLVFQQFQNESLTFSNLKLDTPMSFDFRNVHLIGTSISNEWGFFGVNSSISVSNSSGLWLWPIGTGTWKMFNSHMIEFDPRGFVGKLIFNNSEWANAGEIFEGTNMDIFGTVMITQNLSQHLVLSNSNITRHYPVQNSMEQVAIRFTPQNYKNTSIQKIMINGKSQNFSISLFSDTPLSPISPQVTNLTTTCTVCTTTIMQTTAQAIVQQGSQSFSQKQILLLVVIAAIILVAAISLFFFLKKKQ
ncbi:MAG: hypothetical protein KGH74_04190 [Candidatus Micrarchaeota archaeon]|nr:hypothetical protein [Candidatus Micrarchaeota archaeon]